MDDSDYLAQSSTSATRLSLADVLPLAMQGSLGETISLDLPMNGVLPHAYTLADHFVIVQSGWVALSCDNKAFSILRPGEVFFHAAWPEDAAYAHRNITLSAATPVKLILVERTSFLAVTEPSLMFALYALICQKMLFLMKALVQLNRESVPNRLSYFFYDLGMPLSDGARCMPKLNPVLVADCLGIGLDELHQNRKLLRDSGKFFDYGPDECLSAEVSAMAKAAGFGRESPAPSH